MKSFFQMIKYSELVNYEAGKAAAYNDISTTYFKQGYYEKSISYSLKFIEISKKTKNDIFVGSGLNNLAQTYLKLNDTEKAEKCYKKSIKLMSLVEPKRLGIPYNGLGNVWLKNNNFDSAIVYYQKALKLNESLNLKKYYAKNYLNIAIVFNKKNNSKLALIFASKNLNFGKELKEPQQINEASIFLSQLYDDSKNFKQAYEMLKLSTIMKDSIINDDNKQALFQSEMNYQTQLKEKEVNELSQKKKIAELESKRKTSFLLLFGI